MSMASMPSLRSISARMPSPQGSAPKMPILSEMSSGAIFRRSNSSAMTSE